MYFSSSPRTITKNVLCLYHQDGSLDLAAIQATVEALTELIQRETLFLRNKEIAAIATLASEKEILLDHLATIEVEANHQLLMSSSPAVNHLREAIRTLYRALEENKWELDIHIEVSKRLMMIYHDVLTDLLPSALYNAKGEKQAKKQRFFWQQKNV